MKKRYPHKKNVLLVNITRLGDMLQATPTIAGLKAENPDGKITVLVEKQFEDVCHCIPNIDEVVSIDLGMTVRALAREQEGIIDAYEYLDEFVAKLKEKNFDYCLNMSSSAYTALLIRLLGIEKSGGWTADDEGYRLIESDWAKLFATSVFHQNRQFNSLNLVDVFRCSADVEAHPRKLLINVDAKSLDYANDMIAGAGFTNKGPLVCVQAGASQAKRQWMPSNFIRLVNILVKEHGARVVLTGAKKELSIIEPIKEGCNNPNVFVAAGKTDIPQLAALLELSDILVTGDTGPMHMSVAVGTPVVSMFLASAYGFETGPYSEGNIVIQPVISCGPCNPNKACAQTDCHATMSPELIADLTAMRLRSDFRSLPPDFPNARNVIIYRSAFDEHGFCDLVQLNPQVADKWATYRKAYRQLWLEDIGGFEPIPKVSAQSSLKIHNGGFDGLENVIECAREGQKLIHELVRLIDDVSSPAASLGTVSAQLGELDRRIEQIGFHHEPLGPLTRMFVFAKENIVGTEALELASQMETIYGDLERRSIKLGRHFETFN